MKTQKIGHSDLAVTRLAYGCWRLAGSEGGGRLDPADGRRAVQAAYDAGYTFFDHADIYGRGECERIFGQALREISGARERMVLATKCGICPPWDGAQHCYDSSAGHIVASVEGSLSRMGIEQIDLLMIHRPDYLGDPAEMAAAFGKLREQGKVRWFGVSNFKPSQLTALQAACDVPLVAQQVELSLSALSALDDGTLDQCLAERITPLAWSPLAKGALLGSPRDDREAGLHAHLDLLATRYHVGRAEMALAWLLRHPSRMIPIIGSVNPERIRHSVRADQIEISRDEWYALLIAARGTRLP
jgi:predicted oxidoreductase